MNEVETTVLALLRQQLHGTETPEEVERIARDVGSRLGLPVQVVDSIVRQITGESDAATATSPDSPRGVPRLTVNWEQELQVGWQACPEFHLIGPAEYRSTPRVEVSIDPRLDHAREARNPPVDHEAEGYWIFHVPFSLTTDGEDCRPGQYLITVSVAFPRAKPPVPRYFQSRIRLKVLQPSTAKEHTLEIEGDGKSVLNLQGKDLRSFNRVILKGGENAVVNVAELTLPRRAAEDAMAGEFDTSADQSLCHEYALKVDMERQRALPMVSSRFRRRGPLDAAAFYLSSGARILILARRGVNLGRDRVNDIVLRYLPRTEEHERLSVYISRQHLSLEFTSAGLEVTDRGSSHGTVLGRRRLEGTRLLTVADTDKSIDLTFPGPEGCSRPFRTELTLFRAAKIRHSLQSPLVNQDLICCDALQVDPPRLWELAWETQLDAVRLRRLDNLPEEQYVAVFRQALIGSSKECPICIPDPGLEWRHARLLHLAECFWIENLTASGTVEVEDYSVPPGELVPLTPGMKLTVGETRLRVGTFQQAYL